jgi:hypothetical protein
MFGKFTKKSLIVSAALVAAMIWTGVIAASAHAIFPDNLRAVTPSPQGIPAIAPPRGNAMVSVPVVLRYLHTQGFAGGPTRNGTAPRVQSIQLTNAGTLNRLAHIFIPGLPDKAKVYYARLKGPFTISPTPSRSVLNTLLPDANNLPVLRPLLPAMNHTPGLSKLLGSVPLLNNPPAEAQPTSSGPVLAPPSQRPQGTPGRGTRKTMNGRKVGTRKPTSLGKLGHAPRVWVLFCSRRMRFLTHVPAICWPGAESGM